MPILVPPASSLPSGTLAWKLIDPDNNEHDLTPGTSPNLFVSKGSAGLGSPPVGLVAEKLPTLPGVIVRHATTNGLELDIPLQVTGSTFADLLARVEDLRGWLDTAAEDRMTPAYFAIRRPQDDIWRKIAVLYQGGLEGDMGEGTPTWAPLIVSLLAPDPYWTDETDTELTYDSGDVNVVQAIINSGDFNAYPVWTLVGPASAITISNQTTGESFAFTANGGLTMTAADTLIIDTRPSSQRTDPQVMLDGDSAVFDRLTATSSLWHFRPGQNNFTIAATGATGSTAILLSYVQRYRGVLR
jgi:hypothetical protein